MSLAILPLSLLLVGLVASNGAAQTLVNISMQSPCAACPDTLTTVDLDARAVRRVEALGTLSATSGIYVTPDGRLTAWLDTLTSPPGGGQVLDIVLAVRDSVAGGTGRLSLGRTGGRLLGHPRRTEVFVTGAPSALAPSLAGVRQFAAPPCGLLVPQAVSGDARRIVYSCLVAAPLANLVAFDVESGTVLGTFSGGPAAPILNADGSELYVIDGTAGAVSLRRFAVVSGAELGSVALPSATTIHLLLHPATGRLIAINGQTTRVFDPVTLQEVGFVPIDFGGLWAFDPYRPRAYVLKVAQDQGTTTFRTTLNIVDTDTLALVESIPVPGTAIHQSIAMVPIPAAPASVLATVQGGNVSLSWSGGLSAAETTRYVVEAGSASGLNDIVAGLDVGLQTALAANGVPPGRYYVRVRAGNHAGFSAPSNEVIVQVP